MNADFTCYFNSILKLFVYQLQYFMSSSLRGTLVQYIFEHQKKTYNYLTELNL